MSGRASPVPPVEGVSPRLGQVKPSSEKTNLVKRIEEAWKYLDKAATTARSATTAIGFFTAISATAKDAMSTTKGIKLLGLAFTLRNFVNDIQIVLFGSKEPPFIQQGSSDIQITFQRPEIQVAIWERVNAVFRMILHLDVMADAVATSCSLLYMAKVVSSQWINWIALYSHIALFTVFIALAQSIESLWKSGKLLHDLDVLLQEIEDPSIMNEDRLRHASLFLATLQQEIRPQLIEGMKKEETKTILSLPQKMGAIRNRILIEKGQPGDATQAIEEAEFKTLKGELKKMRSAAKFTVILDAVGLVNTVANIAGRILITLIPAVPWGAIILATTGGVSLVMMGAKTHLVSKYKTQLDELEMVKKINNGIGRLLEQLPTAQKP